MGKYVSSETVKLMIKKSINIRESNILILGFTFKENCPDFRNTKVIDIINDLLTYNLNVEVYDPWLETSDVGDEYSIQLLPSIPSDFGKYQAIILAVGHDKFKELNFTKKPNRVIFDVKSFLDKNIVDGRL
jgi:UDP-N-acetyl-D-galactosamine dehydrogenase